VLAATALLTPVAPAAAAAPAAQPSGDSARSSGHEKQQRAGVDIVISQFATKFSVENLPRADC